MKDFTLNPAQQAVVDHGAGPALIVGCPGAGKTVTIECRVQRLAQGGLPQHLILVVTFTKAAAAEVAGRLAARGCGGVEVKTFHALALAKAQDLRLMPRLRMDDRRALHYARRNALRILKKEGVISRERPVDIGAVEAFISRAKASGFVPVEGNPFGRNEDGEQHVRFVAAVLAEEGLEGLPDPQTCLAIYRDIEQRRSALGLYDFDDMQGWFWQAILVNPEWLRWFQRCYTTVQVDEGQDACLIQHDLGRLAMGLPSLIDPEVGRWDERDHSLNVYGDVSQSLFGWRSATPEALLLFNKEPEVETYLLPCNYRSVPEICSAATRMVMGKRWHLVGEIVPVRQSLGVEVAHDFGPPVIVKEFVSRPLELKWALEYASDPERIGHVTIISRTSASLHQLELMCIRGEIPYIKRAKGFMFDARECRDMIAYLTVIAQLDNPECEAMRQVINAPTCFAHKADIDYCLAGLRQGQTLVDAMLGYVKLPWYVKRDLIRRKDLLRELVGETAPATVIEIVLKKTRYMDWLSEEIGMDPNEGGGLGSEMLEELINMAEGYACIEDFLKFISDMRAAKERKRASKLGMRPPGTVLLSTIHQIKGGSDREIIIVDVCKNKFPSGHSVKSATRMEEELRCFYVAVTRAEDRVFVTFNTSTGPSEFITLARRVIG